MKPMLESVQVGRPGVYDPADPWTSAIFKTPVGDPIELGLVNLAGDEQADLTVHGGPDKAICVYSAEHAASWRLDPGLERWGPGAVGENFTVSGLIETSVAIGDVFEIGSAVVQVSQPRSPCWKLGRRWKQPDLPRRVLRSGRTGWYFRVLRPGRIEPGSPLTLVERPYARLTIAHVNGVTFDRGRERTQVAELAACDALASGWRNALRSRL